MTITDRIATVPAGRPAFNTRKLTPFIGSTVGGLDLKEEQTDTTIAALRALALERGVIFLPDQHLSPAEQVALAARFGTLDLPEKPRKDSPAPGVAVFDSRNGVYGRVPRWHADITSKEVPPTFEIFQPIILPEVGGDTLWASTEAAYDRLAAPLKRLAESLTAIHAYTPVKTTDWGHDPVPFHWAEHPVVTVHPETGRKALYVSPRYTTEIVGLRPHESRNLLDLFNTHIIQPEHIVRYRWTAGTIAIWDNRSSIHYAVDDYDDEVRVVHRVGVVGEPPRGVVRAA